MLKNCNANDVRLFMAALNTFTKSKLDEVREQLSVRGNEYISKVPDCKQYPVASPICLYGQNTTSGVEGINSTNLPFRGMVMFRGCVEFILEYFGRHLVSAARALQIYQLEVLPKTHDKQNLTAVKSFTANYTDVCPQNLDRTLFEVPSARGLGIKYTVNMTNRECSCGKGQVNRFPCTHVFRVCRYAGLDLVSYLHHCDSTWHNKLQYENCGVYDVPPFQFQDEDI